MKRLFHLLDGLLLAVALLLALRLAISTPAGSEPCPPLASSLEELAGLRAPGAPEALLDRRLLALGDWLTVEDLVRVALEAERGELEGIPPLDDAEREELARHLRRIEELREELSRVERELHQVEADFDEQGRKLAGLLTPEQLAWIEKNRDAISVDRVERRYWEELLSELPEEQEP